MRDIVKLFAKGDAQAILMSPSWGDQKAILMSPSWGGAPGCINVAPLGLLRAVPLISIRSFYKSLIS